MDGPDSGDFPRPDVPVWDVFEDAAVKLYYDWDARFGLIN